MIILEHNCTTNEVIEREATPEEIAQREIDANIFAQEEANRLAQEEVKAQIKISVANKLKNLGLTDEEAKVIVGEITEEASEIISEL